MKKRNQINFMAMAKAIQNRNAGARHQRRAIAKIKQQEDKKNGRI